jgi:TonB family protein
MKAAMRVPHVFILMFICLAAVAPAAARDRSMASYYPAEARRDHIAGVAALDCIVAADGRVDCQVADERPADLGFARAAIAASRHYRLAPRTRDGAPTAGGRVHMCFTFEPGPPATVTLSNACNEAPTS